MKKRVFTFLLAFVFSVLWVGGPLDGVAGDVLASAQMAFADGLMADYSADVVVIGAGAAGMPAALEAFANGAENVVVLESMSHVGGSALLILGGMSAADTRYTEPGSDPWENMAEEARALGHTNLPYLIEIVAQNSGEALHWLNDLGAGFSHQFVPGMRMFFPLTTPGPALISALYGALADNNIPVMLNTRATEILVDEDGAVIGVVAERGGQQVRIATTSVVLATGGFGADLPWVLELAPEYTGFATVAHPGNRGDGIRMAEALGADTTHMEYMSIHHVVEPTLGHLYPAGIRDQGGIIINRAGERIVNENAATSEITEAMLAYSVTAGRATSFVIFDQRIREAVPGIESHIRMDLVTTGDTVAELAASLRVDPEALEATITRYNELASAVEDADFGRPEASLHVLEGPFYASVIVPAIFSTLGGIRISPNAQVLRVDDSVVTGLFAAGEVIGGIHGRNRGGGHAITEAAVFGRIAGESAANFARDNAGFTERTIFLAEEVAVVPQVQGNFTDGIFEGSARGHNGRLTVSVSVENNNIVAIDLTDHQETAFMYQAAHQSVANQIIKTQSLAGIDVATGATITSFAILLAVNNALAD